MSNELIIGLKLAGVVAVIIGVAALLICAAKPYEAKEEEEEPLPVLADRKGFTAWAGRLPKLDNKWSVELQNKKETKFFNADTYTAAESLAREYLEKMEDVK